MLREGLLWYDNNPKRKLADKVAQAANRYQDRFGCPPNACYLNQADLESGPDEVDGIQLHPAPNILRHHLWLGVEGNA